MKKRFITFGLITSLAAMTVTAQSSRGGGVGGAPAAGAPMPGTPGGRVTTPGASLRAVSPAVQPPAMLPSQPDIPANQTIAPPVIVGPSVGFAAGTNGAGVLTSQFQPGLRFSAATNELRPGLQANPFASTNVFRGTNVFFNTNAFFGTNVFSTGPNNQFSFGTNQFGIVTNGFGPGVFLTQVPVLTPILIATGTTNPIIPSVPDQPSLPPPGAGMTQPLPSSPGGP